MRSSKRMRVMPKPLYHESIWKTDNTSAGSSNDDQVALPFVATGSYDCIVKWGDGTQDYITVWNQAETTHTYDAIGTYTIEIIGKCEGWKFNNTGDKLKILSIERWGKDFKLGNAGSYFYGCANLEIDSSDILNTDEMTSFYEFFRGCSNLNWNVKFSNTENVTTLWAMFYECTAFNGNLDSINTSSVEVFDYMFYDCDIFNQNLQFDTSSATNMQYMFRGCHAFNGTLENFNTANVTSMYAMFFDCNVFNQSVSQFDTSNVTNMQYMFFNCIAFNQDISNFNIESVTNVQNMLEYATSWSTANYDAFLIEIATNQNVVDSLTFHCSSTYTLGGAAAAARADLIATDLWTINDSGGV